VATAGGKRAVTPRHCGKGYSPLKAETRVRRLMESPHALLALVSRRAILRRVGDAADRDGQRACHHLTCPVGDTSQRFCAVTLACFRPAGAGLGSIVSVPESNTATAFCSSCCARPRVRHGRKGGRRSPREGPAPSPRAANRRGRRRRGEARPTVGQAAGAGRPGWSGVSVCLPSPRSGFRAHRG
jgi:hypothetical protein